MRGDLTQADDRAEHRAALEMIYRHSPGSTRKLTLGTDKGFDAAEFVADLLWACVMPHVAQKSRYSVIDGQSSDTKRNDGWRTVLAVNGSFHVVFPSVLCIVKGRGIGRPKIMA